MSSVQNTDKTKNILMEIIETEKNFNKALKTMPDSYLTPLKNSKFSKNPKVQAFLNATEPFLEIIKISDNLLKNLNEIQPPIDSTKAQDIVNIFSDFSQNKTNLEKYVQFANAYDDMIQCAKTLEKSSNIKNFLTNQKSGVNRGNTSQGGKDIDISSLLLEPIQRMPRYKLLLEELAKNLPTKEEIQPAINEINKINNTINQTRRENDIQKALSMPYSSTENRSIRSVEFSNKKLEEFFNPSMINTTILSEKLKKAEEKLTQDFAKKGMKFSIQKNASNPPIITVTIKNNNGTKSTFKLEIIAEKQEKNSPLAHTFCVRIKPPLVLAEDKHKKQDFSERKEYLQTLYHITETVGTCILDSLKPHPNIQDISVSHSLKNSTPLQPTNNSPILFSNEYTKPNPNTPKSPPKTSPNNGLKLKK